MDEQQERCVLCGCVTSVPIAMPVGQRTSYVEGCGQLCAACWQETYGRAACVETKSSDR